MFKRNGKLKSYGVKIRLKDVARIIQRKRRRISIQLQKSFHAVINQLLQDGHIEKVNECKGRRFYPTNSNYSKERLFRNDTNQ